VSSSINSITVCVKAKQRQIEEETVVVVVGGVRVLPRALAATDAVTIFFYVWIGVQITISRCRCRLTRDVLYVHGHACCECVVVRRW
jgi:hypothetical protein